MHGEGIAERQRLFGGALAQGRLAQDHAGEEGAKREGHAEQLGRGKGGAKRDDEHRQPEQLAAAGMRHVVQHPGDQALADDQHDGDEGRDLADGQRGGCGNAGRIRGASALAAEHAGKGRQQHERQHHHHVFDDEPADGDAAAPGLDQAALLECAQKNHGARHRQRQAEHEAGADRPAEPMAKRHAEQRGAGDLHDGAGHGDRPHREQLLEREMQADAEHQQDDADLGELACERLVGDEARRRRADQHAGDEIADERRQTQPMGERAEHPGESQRDDDGGDQGMGHRSGTPQAVVPSSARAGGSGLVAASSGDVLGTVTALRTSSIMARAISNSPMITVEAPCFFK